MSLKAIINEAEFLSNPEKGVFAQRFFKTGPGQYGEGDVFMGLTVPQTRVLARKYQNLALPDVLKLLQRKEHELRLMALHLLVYRAEKARTREALKEVVDAYLSHLDYVNNWDLVDTSAHKILGRWLLDTGDRSILWELAKSTDLWRQRVAMVATFWLLKHGEFEETTALAEYFLPHKHDLMHKASGWMLREMGKQDTKPLYAFLDAHAGAMPRTMLRYAIEKLSPEERARYMTIPRKKK